MEKKEDLISRQAAIEILNKLARDNFTINDAFAFYLGALHDAADGIKALPSTQPQRMRGRWIESNLVPSRKGKPDGRLFICSECNKGWVKHDRSMEGINFCPNCGADMREGQDE